MPDPISGTIAAVSVGSGVAGTVMGGNAKDKAAKSAMKSNAAASKYATDKQWDMFNTTRNDYEPFRRPGGEAMATLESMILGGNRSYQDPNYELINPDELTGLLKAAATYTNKTHNGSGLSDLMAGSSGQTDNPLLALLMQKKNGKVKAPTIDPTLKYYRNKLTGGVVNSAPMIEQGGYDVSKTPGYDWRMGQLERALRMRGRSDSSAGDFLRSNAYADEYDRGISRVSGLADIARGAVSNLGNMGASVANNVGNIAIQNARTQGDLSLMRGENKANLYNELFNVPSQLGSSFMMGKGMKLF